MDILSLNGVWRLTGSHQITKSDPLSLWATVPGCVQLDLSAAGLLPSDLYVGENILQAEQYEDYEWRYERTFEAPAQRKNVYLVFEGADCLAEYYLNGNKIGESENALIAHEFRIDEFLRDGENTLAVHFRSATLEALTKDYDLKLLSSQSNLDARHIRKPPHSYGWDIMPRAVTVGLWREVRLEMRDPIYFEQAFIHYYRDMLRFYFVLSCEKQELLDAEIEISASCGEDSNIHWRQACPKAFGHLRIPAKDLKLWYPYGYGEPNVYDGFLRIWRKGSVIHEEPFSFGIRSVELDREDAVGGRTGRFRFLVNGIEVMCRGSNWVPMDAFHCRDAERYEKALSLVKDIGCNILRCWGGNVYEDHAFFDFCDRNGIMVWQDFAMACAFYPENDEFKALLANEAVAVIRKLRQHPSIIVWAGDNEVDACASTAFDPNDNSLTREVLAKCVELNDIGRPYLPSSPYISPAERAVGARSQVIGTPLVEEHLWGPRDYFKSEFYKGSAAHFVSETGYHGCPSLSSIKKFITPERVWPYTDNPEWILHSSDQTGNDSRVMLMEKQVRQLFGEVPAEPERYILASQISQAEAKKYFIERMRVARPHATGIIWWNLLDGWPQMSDAVVDYYYEKKLAYGYIKRCQAPFAIIAGELGNWKLPIYACNDTLKEAHGRLTVKDAMSEALLYEGDFSAAANTSTLIAQLPLYYSEQKILLLEWQSEDGNGWNHYLCGFPPISLEQYLQFIEKYHP